MLFESSIDAINAAQENVSALSQRIEVARDVFADLSGDDDSGLTLTRIGQYTVVDDGHDRWLVHSFDYERYVDSIIKDILDGSLSLSDGDSEYRKEAYDNLCSRCRCIYSNIGTPSDVDALLATLSRNSSLTAGQCGELLDLLNIDDDDRIMGTITIALWSDDLNGIDLDDYGEFLCEKYQADYPLWCIEYVERQTLHSECRIDCSNPYFSSDDYFNLEGSLEVDNDYFNEFCGR